MSKLQANDNSKNLSKANLFSLLGQYRSIILLLIIFALAGNASNLVIPKIVSHSIDSYVDGKFNFHALFIQFLSATLSIFIFTYFQSILQTLASERVAKNLRSKLSEKISRQGLTFINKANPSKLLTNLTSDMDSVKMFISMAVANIVSSIFMIIAIFVLMLTINRELALVVIAIVPVIMATFYIVVKKVRVLFKKSREVIDRLNKIINESILGSALIRVLNAQQPEYEKFLSTNQDARDLGLAILRLFAIMIPIIMFVSNLAVVSILALGGHFVVINHMSLGEFAAFYSYLSMLIFPILMIGFMSNIIAQASASYQRIYNVLQTPDTSETGTKIMELKGNINLENVNLSYGEKPVLKNISIKIEKKSRTAILGPTAAGKSQLLNLLSRLIYASSGDIRFEDALIQDFDKDSFYSQVGLVFQDSVIFNMSLRENIAFSDKVTNEAFRKAVETAELTDFIDSLPQKLDTIITERGSNLSGGQKQRIMLARALSTNPKILLLDDFTSRVDRKTENKILCNLENNYPDLTLISVTQKVSSVKNFDQIILLMEGEIIAQGKHKDLLSSCLEYVQIYNSQRSTHHYEL